MFGCRNVESTMKRSSKIVDEARHAVAVAATSERTSSLKRKRKVEVGTSLCMRRELLRQFVPQYQEASSAHKRVVLTDFIRLTGYHRKYAISLLNKIQDEQQTVKRPSRCMYGSDVEEALVQVWEQTNGLCSKRLIPFLPTVLEAMERHGHLHLTPECRGQLLALSVATTDRLLRPHRQRVMRGLCTTRAGTLLKQNIPIRTFEQWDEQVPGFVEADLVAHCDSSVEGSYLFTLTLTDIATGWTECLPVLRKSAEGVLAAIKQARSLFPFPLLGLDTDNGTEFMNEHLIEYCEQEQITFTRGRPALKNDQCYVEQKNGHIVRQVVGYSRYVGEQACQCLGELYRILSRYVNFFQPSMKLCATLKQGRKVRRIYDEAKTPFQRVLHAEVLPAEHEHLLTKQFEDLDIVRLVEQVKQAQRTLFHCATSSGPASEEQQCLTQRERFRVVGTAHLPFAVDVVAEGETDVTTGEGGSASREGLLAWHRMRTDPFAGEWERIAEWVCADPTRRCRAMLEELCRLSPERYHPSHLRTLQRGVQKIRVRLALLDGQPRENGQHASVSFPDMSNEQKHPQQNVPDREVLRADVRAEQEQQEKVNEPLMCGSASSNAREPADEVVCSCWADGHEHREAACLGVQLVPVQDEDVAEALEVYTAETPTLPVKPRVCVTVEEGIEEYLAAQQRANRRPKTLEWHETALHLLEQYLRTEWEGVLLVELREEHVHGWMQWLAVPTALGIHRTEGTITSYARSARAWCCWLVKTGSLMRTLFARIRLAKGEPSVMEPLHQEQWERLLHACQGPGENGTVAEWASARNQALLWVLYDTGMKVSEVCALWLGDVDVERGTLVVRSGHFKSRRLTLGQKAAEAVRVYVEVHRHVGSTEAVQQVRLSEVPLFLSETGHALTTSGVMTLFVRLRRRAGLSREEMGPTLIRDSFALRYLQAGGDVFSLRDLLGHQESAAVKRFLRMNHGGRKNDKHKKGGANS